jgi:hypothetical protein
LRRPVPRSHHVVYRVAQRRPKPAPLSVEPGLDVQVKPRPALGPKVRELGERRITRSPGPARAPGCSR